MADIIFKEITYRNIRKNTYFVSEDGEIYSKLQNKILKPKIDKDGYAYLRLGIENSSNFKDFAVAHLVIHTFQGEPPITMKDPTVDHINNKKLDNRNSNLQYLEHDDNCAKINPNHKLEDYEVHDICKLLKAGNNCSKIARMYGVTPMTINNIKRKQSWTKISDLYF